MGKEAEDPQPVVERNKYATLCGHRLPVVSPGCRPSGIEPATIYPDNHRPFVIFRHGPGPHIEIKTVFIHGLFRHKKFRGEHEEGKWLYLDGAWAESLARPYSGPRLNGLRCLPP